MSEEYLLGIDLGTSAVKVLLAPIRDGTFVGGQIEASVECSVSMPHPGWSEQNPEDWWSATCEATRSVLGRSQIEPSRVSGIAVSGQMHGAVLLDAHGSVLRPCILWNDQRSAGECDWIMQEIGLARLLSWVGNPALAGFTAPKLLWVRQHEPDLFARVATILLPKDYLNFRLTGAIATEFSDASGTLLLDIAARRWSAPMLEALDLPASILPTLVLSSAVIGRIVAEAANATGLSAGTPVVAGGADNACAAVGANVISPGRALVSLGTSGTVLAPSAGPSVDQHGRLHTFCHAVPDTWYQMGVVLAAGTSVRWFRDVVAPDYRDDALRMGRNSYDLLTEGAASVKPGSDGLIFLPYLMGERTPHGDPYARGVFFGLTPSHTRHHMFRSVLEGVTFALADALALLQALGMELRNMQVTGGGSNSPLWCQIVADVFNMDVTRSRAAEGPAIGAAIIAGVGTGLLDWGASFEGENNSDLLLRPDVLAAENYSRVQHRFDALYPALRPLFRMSEAEGQ